MDPICLTGPSARSYSGSHEQRLDAAGTRPVNPPVEIDRGVNRGMRGTAGAGAERRGINMRRGIDMGSQIEADVVIAGAGLTGLTAARRLTQAGLDVVVLEAKDRVGGRIDNASIGSEGKYTEIGGRYVGPAQHHILGLAREVGVGVFETYVTGSSIFYFQGRRMEYDPAEGLPLSAAAKAEHDAARDLLDEMASDVPADAPWAAPKAAEYDRMSFDAWLSAHLTDPAARFAVEFLHHMMFMVPPWQVSLLQALVLHNARGWDSGAGKWRFVGGSVEVARRVAAELGDKVHLGSPVRRIDQTAGDRVTVTAEGIEVVARECIVAMSPTEARFIEFRPGLPVRRELLHRRAQAGSAIITHAVYEEPFWRTDGLNGVVKSDLGGAPLTIDNSPSDGSPGILLTFLVRMPEGSNLGLAKELEDDPAARRAAVLSALAEYFGPRALRPIDFLEKEWLYEPYCGGCQSPMPPGLYTATGSALKDPVGLVHWASTETASRWWSYMDGAVESGERVAAEVRAICATRTASRSS